MTMEFRDHGAFDDLMYGLPTDVRWAGPAFRDQEEILDPDPAGLDDSDPGWGGRDARDGYGRGPDESPHVPPATAAHGEDFFFAPDL